MKIKNLFFWIREFSYILNFLFYLIIFLTFSFDSIGKNAFFILLLNFAFTFLPFHFNKAYMEIYSEEEKLFENILIEVLLINTILLSTLLFYFKNLFISIFYLQGSEYLFSVLIISLIPISLKILLETNLIINKKHKLLFKSNLLKNLSNIIFLLLGLSYFKSDYLPAFILILSEIFQLIYMLLHSAKIFPEKIAIVKIRQKFLLLLLKNGGLEILGFFVSYLPFLLIFYHYSPEKAGLFFILHKMISLIFGWFYQKVNMKLMKISVTISKIEKYNLFQLKLNIFYMIPLLAFFIFLYLFYFKSLFYIDNKILLLTILYNISIIFLEIQKSQLLLKYHHFFYIKISIFLNMILFSIYYIASYLDIYFFLSLIIIFKFFLVSLLNRFFDKKNISLLSILDIVFSNFKLFIIYLFFNILIIILNRNILFLNHYIIFTFIVIIVNFLLIFFYWFIFLRIFSNKEYKYLINFLKK